MQDTVRTKLVGETSGVSYVDSFTKSAQPNSEFEAHIHPNKSEIYLFSKGELFFVVEGKRIEVEKGDVVIIANDTYHRPIIKKPCTFKRTHIFIDTKALISFAPQSTELFKRIRKKRVFIIPAEKAKQINAEECFSRVQEFLLEGTPYGEFCATVTVISFLMCAERMALESQEPTYASYSSTVTDIMEFISENLTSRLDYHTISNQFHLSEKYLYKLFKKETGITLANYILERRIIKAQSVLNAGGMVNEAAQASGFADYSTFYRSFLRETGLTPSQYTKYSKK